MEYYCRNIVESSCDAKKICEYLKFEIVGFEKEKKNLFSDQCKVANEYGYYFIVFNANIADHFKQ